MTTVANQAFSELVAPPAWRTVDLISDLHLQAGEPATFEAWQGYLQTTPAPVPRRDRPPACGGLRSCAVSEGECRHVDAHGTAIGRHRLTRR